MLYWLLYRLTNETVRALVSSDLADMMSAMLSDTLSFPLNILHLVIHFFVSLIKIVFV